MTGFVVSHTHWDRAWYLPFERFRVRLVRLVERLCDLLDADPAFAAFTLDGQTVLLDDVFDVRPDLRPRVERLVRARRLVVGPFYILPDLFLVSFESLARNLSRGLAMRAAMGAPDGDVPVGYVPDPFGQPAAMPTLLRGFGIETFFFSRGLGPEHGTDDPLARTPPRAAFWWDGPGSDGTGSARVLALYGRDGYFNAAALGHADDYGRYDGATPDAARAAAQIEATAARFAGLLPPGAPMLLLNGFDHMPEQPGLPALLGTVARDRPDWTLRHASLDAYAAAFRAALDASGEALPVVRGDLLGNVHHPILSSVWSTRLYLKRAHDAAERFLVDVAEPLAAMLPGPDSRPFLGLAWRHLLRAQPHDDLCGCSLDAVHEDTEAEIRHAAETALEATRERLDALVMAGIAPATRPDGTPAPDGADVIVVHPHPHAARVTVDADVWMANDGGEFGTTPPARRLAAVDGEGHPVEVVVLETAAPVLRSAYLSATWGRRYRVRLTLDAPPCGYTLVRVFEDDGRPTTDDERPTTNDQQPTTDAIARRLRVEWERDAGDTYSFSPVLESPDDAAPRVWTATLDATAPHPSDPAAIVATWTIEVPARLNDDPTGLSLRPDTSIETVRMTLRADLRDEGAAGVSVRVAFDNRASDGRLRIVLPTTCGEGAALRTGTHLGLAPRVRIAAATPETAPERHTAFPGELDYATHPMREFALVDDAERRAWIASRGLPEIEMHADDGETWIAVTLCRSVGWLSRKGGRIRRVAAGPQLPTPGAQCLREMTGALLIGSADAGAISDAAAIRHARAFARPAWALELPVLPDAAPPSGPPAPRVASWLAVDDDAVWALSVHPEAGESGRVIRLVNPTDAPRTATLTLGADERAARRTDLREVWADGADVPVEDGRARVAMAPGEVVTLVVRGDRRAA